MPQTTGYNIANRLMKLFTYCPTIGDIDRIFQRDDDGALNDTADLVTWVSLLPLTLMDIDFPGLVSYCVLVDVGLWVIQKAREEQRDGDEE